MKRFRWISIALVLTLAASSRVEGEGRWVAKSASAVADTELAVVGTLVGLDRGVDGSLSGAITVDEIVFGAAEPGDRVPLIIEADETWSLVPISKQVGRSAFWLLRPGREGFFSTVWTSGEVERSPYESSQLLWAAGRALCADPFGEKGLSLLGFLARTDPATGGLPRVVVLCRDRREPLQAVVLPSGVVTELDGPALSAPIVARKARLNDVAVLLRAVLDGEGRLGEVGLWIDSAFHLGEHVTAACAGWRLSPDGIGGPGPVVLLVPFELLPEEWPSLSPPTP